MPALETNIENIHWAKQSAKDSLASTPTKAGRKVTGAFGVGVAYGAEEYSDGKRFAAASDYVDTIQGTGNPGIQAQPGPLAHLIWLFLGSEAVSDESTYYQHVLVPGSSGFWSTFWYSVGSSVVWRKKFGNCRISQLVIEGSSGSKVVRLTPTIMSLKPGIHQTSSQTLAIEADEPWLYTEAEGTFNLNSTVIRGHSAFTITLTDDLNPYYGDSVVPQELTQGRGRIDLSANILLDQSGVDYLHSVYYGTTSPSADAEPIHTMPALGTYSFTMSRTGNRMFKTEFPAARFNPTDFPAGNPAGGAAELTISGGGRISGSNPMVRFTINNADQPYTV